MGEKFEIPKDLLYSKEHEWVKVDGDIATQGITDIAQHILTDIVFVELPKVGAKVEQSKSFMVIESVKSVSDVNARVSGEIVEINEELTDNPAIINEDPYKNGWLVKIKMKDESKVENMLSSEDYGKHCEEAKH
ncbi:glycine cleavage system protein GcvH [archaeon]|jgi:glycine cleavage system H protein|nr:glycine cleavage system protein GcvH [archaeon]MBT4352078.1 glycine cleavage system protein GcvH [archaeon]MBT4648556.1 glycine cleavage system protein GcvH [archaeon]MBT6822624.1 glycine cleavage system protein GcvH [archaeon]MBT7392672.1 glycine cleavage system protein GcvH [archaeon]